MSTPYAYTEMMGCSVTIDVRPKDKKDKEKVIDFC